MIWQRFKEGTIRRQIVTLAVLPILLVGVLGVMTEPPFPEATELTQAEIAAAQIALVADQIDTAATPEVADLLLAASAAAGLPVERISSFAPEGAAQSDFETRLIRALVHSHHRAAWLLDEGGGAARIAVELRGGLLAFAPKMAPVPALDDHVINILLSVVIIVLPVAFLSIYAARLLTGPLTRIAAAAAQEDADPAGVIFDESGPLEIRALARRLNEMRAQIHRMLSQRTAMLRAVSHDLRTPLTRLRLRIERSVPAETAAVLIRDIEAIDDLVNETLTYLRSDSQTETLRKVDLPSLLSTICSDFLDVGFDVSYAGPERLAFLCYPRALVRAISNLVDNGTKFGSSVTITLDVRTDGGVRIEVADDGPGLPEALRTQLLEPFAKGDPARGATAKSGFGLGLSIARDIVNQHRGQIELSNNEPTGLRVILSLPRTEPKGGDPGAHCVVLFDHPRGQTR